MMFFTNCGICCFYKDQKCSLGKWDSPGLKGRIVACDGTHEIHNRICQFHRTSGWEAVYDDPIARVEAENLLRYSLVVDYSPKDENYHGAFNTRLEDLCSSKWTPRHIFVVDRNYSDKEPVQITADTSGIPVTIKKAIQPRDFAFFLDQFAMGNKIQTQYYIACTKLDAITDWKFYSGIDHKMNKQMLKLLWAGNEDLHVTMPNLHILSKSNIDAYLLQSNQCSDQVYTYDQVCDPEWVPGQYSEKIRPEMPSQTQE